MAVETAASGQGERFRSVMKNGRPAVRGACTECSTKTFRLGNVEVTPADLLIMPTSVG